MARRERAPSEVRERDRSYYAGREPAGDYVETGPPRGRRRGTADRSLVWLLAAVAVGLLIWAVWATWWQGPDSSAGPEAGITLTEVADNPSEFAGSTVVVSGEVAGESGVFGDAVAFEPEVFGQNGFLLGEDPALLVVGTNLPETIGQQFAQQDETFELGPDQSIGDVLGGDVVQVTGTVQMRTFAELEEEFGFDFGLDGDAAEQQTSVLRAESVALVPTTQAGEVANVTESALLDNPQEFLYSQVRLQDATVGQAISNRAFTLGDGQVAVLTNRSLQIQSGQTLDISGIVVEPTTAAIAGAFGVQTQDGTFEFDAGVFQQEFGFDAERLGDFDAVILSGFRPVQPGTGGS